MIITKMSNDDLKMIKAIYLESFPKEERKPFFSLKSSIKKGKAIVYVAKDENKLCGFIITYPYKNMVLVDYLAISKDARSKGTGSLLVQDVIKTYKDKIIVLLIEKINHKATNYNMRVARKKFYIKNGFKETNLFINGVSGKMEILSFNGSVDGYDFIEIMKYALGNLYFKLSKIEIIK